MRKLITTIILILFSLTVVAQITSENLSPTDTLKAYIDAASKKDVAGMKSHLSQGTLKLMEDGAKLANRILDDMLKEESGQMPPEAVNIKYSNEKIDGDNATVEMTSQSQTAIMPLVKENGEWKLALDKFIQDMKTKMTADSKPAKSASPKKVGVPACDNYLSKYEACMTAKVPEAALAQLNSALEQTRKSWRQSAKNPRNRASLASACKMATDQARIAMKAYNCEF